MQAGMHISKKEATETRPAEVPQNVLVKGSNLPHCERPVDEQASVRLVAELKHAAGAMGPQSGHETKKNTV